MIYYTRYNDQVGSVDFELVKVFCAIEFFVRNQSFIFYKAIKERSYIFCDFQNQPLRNKNSSCFQAETNI